MVPYCIVEAEATCLKNCNNSLSLSIFLWFCFTPGRYSPDTHHWLSLFIPQCQLYGAINTQAEKWKRLVRQVGAGSIWVSVGRAQGSDRSGALLELINHYTVYDIYIILLKILPKVGWSPWRQKVIALHKGWWVDRSISYWCCKINTL